MHLVVSQAKAEAARLFPSAPTGGSAAARSLLSFSSRLQRSVHQIVREQFSGSSLQPEQAREAAETVVALTELRQQARDHARRALNFRNSFGFRRDEKLPESPKWTVL